MNPVKDKNNFINESKEDKKPPTIEMSLEKLKKICSIFQYLGNLKKGEKISVDQNLNVSVSLSKAKEYKAFSISNTLSFGLVGWATESIARKINKDSISKTTIFFSEDLPKTLETQSQEIDIALQSLTTENAEEVLGILRDQLHALAVAIKTINAGLINLKSTYNKKSEIEKNDLSESIKKLLQGAGSFCAKNLLKVENKCEELGISMKKSGDEPLSEDPKIKEDSKMETSENLNFINLDGDNKIDELEEEKSIEAVNNLAEYFPEVKTEVETAPIQKKPNLDTRSEQLKYLVKIAEIITKTGIPKIDEKIEAKKLEIEKAKASETEDLQKLEKELETLIIYREAAQFAQHKTLQVKKDKHPYAFKFVTRLQDHVNYIFQIEQKK